MTHKSLQRNEKRDIKEASRGDVGASSPALEHRHLDRRRPMSRYGQYSDSARLRNPETYENIVMNGGAA